MLAAVGTYAAPFILTLSLAALIRWAAGSDRAPRFVGLAVPVGFLLCWGIVVEPGWRAFEPVGRLGHILLGAALLGVALDNWRPRRWLAAVAVLIFVIGAAWAEVGGALAYDTRADAAAMSKFVMLLLRAAGWPGVWNSFGTLMCPSAPPARRRCCWF